MGRFGVKASGDGVGRDLAFCIPAPGAPAGGWGMAQDTSPISSAVTLGSCWDSCLALAPQGRQTSSEGEVFQRVSARRQLTAELPPHGAVPCLAGVEHLPKMSGLEEGRKVILKALALEGGSQPLTVQVLGSFSF